MKSKNTTLSSIKSQSIFRHPKVGVIRKRLSVSDFLVRERMRSQICKGAIIDRVVGMKCPHCGNEGEEIKHGHVECCIKCGLVMEVHGNSLDCMLETQLLYARNTIYKLCEKGRK